MSPPTEHHRTRSLSHARRRALSILHPKFPMSPAVFANYMWPISPSWTRATRAGGGIRLKASTFLSRLERDGLARHCDASKDALTGYVLTRSGEQSMESDAGPFASPVQRVDHHGTL